MGVKRALGESMYWTRDVAKSTRHELEKTQSWPNMESCDFAMGTKKMDTHQHQTQTGVLLVSGQLTTSG